MERNGTEGREEWSNPLNGFVGEQAEPGAGAPLARVASAADPMSLFFTKLSLRNGYGSPMHMPVESSLGKSSVGKSYSLGDPLRFSENCLWNMEGSNSMLRGEKFFFLLIFKRALC